MGNPAWETRRDDIARIVERGQALGQPVRDGGDRLAASPGKPTSPPPDDNLAPTAPPGFAGSVAIIAEAMATFRGILRGIAEGRLGRAAENRRRRDREPGRDRGRSTTTPTSASSAGTPSGPVWKGTNSDWHRLAAVVSGTTNAGPPGSLDDHRLIKSRLDDPSVAKSRSAC